jgi:hypothetical protein
MAALVMAIVGCASVPTYKAHPELTQRKGEIRTIGLLPPVISMYEEQPKFGMNTLVPHDEWSPAAVDSVMKAFAKEAAANGWTLKTITTDDPELKEMVELFGAVQFSILRHSWDVPTNAMPPREPFPEKVRTLDYSVGPLPTAMERYQIDTICIIRGFNMLPTSGARLKEGLEITLSVLAAMGGAPVPVFTLKKLGLSVTLVDKNGNVLYFGMVDDNTVGQALPERPGETASAKGELDPKSPADQAYLENDLRNFLVARHYIKAALSGYRGEAEP